MCQQVVGSAILYDIEKIQAWSDGDGHIVVSL